jgi:anti-sigma factor RsiW
VKIDCCQLAELLFDYVSGELPDEKRSLLEEHLRRCPPCLVYVETYRVTIRVTKCLKSAPLPPDVAQRLRAVIERECPQQRGESPG